MRATILTVGTEILFGQIVNTNTVFLSRELNAMGFDVMYHHTVGDNAVRLEEIINKSFDECDLIVTTGGLGPTEDDLTKETIAKAMHDKLERHEESLKALLAYAEKRHWNMTENNYKQVMMPTRATVFSNPEGTAPGFALTEERGGRTKIIISMPGPPREMKPMWENHAVPYLLKLQDSVISYKIIRTFGLGESAMETVLLPLIDSQTDPTIATYAKEGECSLRIASKRKTKAEADEMVSDMIEKIRGYIGEFIYSEDNLDLNEVTGRLLIEKGLTISSCESCTGGLFSEMLIRVPGISEVYDRGLVTYSNKAKIEELGVKEETLDKYTAESKEVALEMVLGLYEKTKSTICVSSTGVAGPGELNGKPAGNMWIGLCINGVANVIELKTGRDRREWNRLYCTLVMMNEIRKICLNMN